MSFEMCTAMPWEGTTWNGPFIALHCIHFSSANT